MSRFGKFLLVLCIAVSPAASKGQEPAPTPTPIPSPEPPAPSETPPPEATPPAPEEAPAPPISAAAAPSATYFNPAIAVIGNFVGVTGRNEVEDRPSLQMLESEVTFQAVVDPYARADFFVAITDDEVELEEGFITFTSLPADLLVKAGKFKAQFGKVNPDALPHAAVGR